MALVSAHRGGAGLDRDRENSLAAVATAVDLGVDLVEVDVWVTAEGRAVVGHDEPTPGVEEVALDDVLALLAGRAGAHVDLKTADGREVDVAARAVEVLGADAVLLTSAEDASVRRLVAWSAVHAPGVRVGLSSAAPLAAGGRVAQVRARLVSWFPRTRLRRSGAHVVVAHHVLARWWLHGWARRRGLPLVVWTVDSPGDLARWVADPHTWVVTTNHPARALRLRDQRW